MSVFRLDVCCTQCGGPLTMTADAPHITMESTMTIETDEHGVDHMTVDQKSGWCGPCLAEWDERMGLT